jgi:hypothetical protein
MARLVVARKIIKASPNPILTSYLMYLVSFEFPE